MDELQQAETSQDSDRYQNPYVEDIEGPMPPLENFFPNYDVMRNTDITGQQLVSMVKPPVAGCAVT